jgi:Putative DNA-binding domain
MLPDDVLQSLIRTSESQYLERKVTKPKDSELRKTICAFANSTPEGRHSVLLLGVSDAGTVIGLSSDSIDKTQRDIIAMGKEDFYPPITLDTQLVVVEGKTVVAVIVEHSMKRPHFAGHSYVRNGPTSRQASENQYNEFVLDRIDKVRRILREKGNIITVEWPNHDAYELIGQPPINRRDYTVKGCDAFCLQLEDINVGLNIAIPIESVTITHDMSKNRLMLVMKKAYPLPPSPTLEQINQGLTNLHRNIIRR